MANIINLSRKIDGNNYATENFQWKEFACKDGSDFFKIDKDLMPIVQRFREYVEAPVQISSAYRNEAYNRKVGGVNGSYHTTGQAIDIPYLSSFKYLNDPYKMAAFFNTLKVPSIIVYDWGVHIDTRGYVNHLEKYSGGYRNIYINKVNVPLHNILKKGSKNNEVGVLQFMLSRLGYSISVDCDFGNNTEKIVKEFQKKEGIKEDGIVGNETWKRLLK